MAYPPAPRSQRLALAAAAVQLPPEPMPDRTRIMVSNRSDQWDVDLGAADVEPGAGVRLGPGETREFASTGGLYASASLLKSVGRLPLVGTCDAIFSTSLGVVAVISTFYGIKRATRTPDGSWSASDFPEIAGTVVSYAQRADKLYIATNAQRVVYSEDGGQTWASAVMPGFVTLVLNDPENGLLVRLDTGQILIGEDPNDLTPNGYPAWKYLAVTMDPAYISITNAGVIRYDYGPSDPGDDVIANLAGGVIGGIVAFSGSRVYAFRTDGVGLVSSADLYAAWTPQVRGIPVYAGAEGLITRLGEDLWFTSDGVTWRKIASMDAAPKVSPATDGFVLVSGTGTVHLMPATLDVPVSILEL